MSHQEEYWINRVKTDGLILKNIPIEYWTKNVCIAAVNQNGYAIQYIVKQVEKISSQTIQQHVKNTIMKDIYSAAIRQNGLSLQYIEDQT